MKKLLILLAIGAVGVGCTEQKTAYVDNARLMQESSQMQNVQRDFMERSERISAELDSEAREIRQEMEAYQEERTGLSQTEQQEREGQLMQRQQGLQQRQQMQSNQLREESNQVYDSLMTNVKSIVAEYGEENNYSIILGASGADMIMYAEEELDITDEILEEINEGTEEVPETDN